MKERNEEWEVASIRYLKAIPNLRRVLHLATKTKSASSPFYSTGIQLSLVHFLFHVNFLALDFRLDPPLFQFIGQWTFTPFALSWF